MDGSRRTALAAAGLVLACSGRTHVESSDASADPIVETTTLTAARALARPERDVAEVLRGRLALQPVGDALVVTPSVAGDLAMRVPTHATEPTRIGTDDEHSVLITLEGASETLVESESGVAVQHDAYPGTDAIWATTEARAELLFMLRDASAPTSYRLHLDHGAGLTRVEADRSSVTFRDARGHLRLQIPAPVALDANGTRRVAEMRLLDEGHTLQITLDDSGLARPILLDPAITQGRWTLIGERDRRAFGSLAWDPLRRKTIAYGGYISGGNDRPGATATKMFEYAIPARTFVGLADGPFGFTSAMLGGSPYYNYGYFAAFDSARGKLIAIGSNQYDCSMGCTAFNRMEVREWDSATNAWASRCTGTCATTAPPAAQTGIEVVYDVARNYTVVCNTGTRACSTWNGTSTTGAWTAITSFPVGMGRGFYDTKFGAATFMGADGTYSWTGSAWSKRTTSAYVGAIAVTYDTIRKRAIALVAGSFGALNLDTYEWDGTAAAWTLIATATTSSPYNKTAVAMAFDPVNGRAITWAGGNGQTGATLHDFTGFVFEYQAFGNACAGDVDCSGGSCRDGFCCDAQCGECQRCDGPGNGGVCATVVGAAAGTEHDTCTGTKACDPAGACKAKNGQACTSGNQCVSGACVDGFCCAGACNQACEVCSATPGTCTPAPKGSSGRTSCGVGSCNGTLRTCSNACTVDSDCSASGYCQAGTCVATIGDGTACTRDRQCTNGSCRDGVCCNSSCDGPCNSCSTGTCTALPSTAKPTACAGYACTGTSGACATGCTADAQCATGYYCDGAFCQKTRAQGETCARSSQCTSGLTCADGVCCNSACDGACQACAAANKQSGDTSGVCGAARAGSDPGDRCPSEDASTCGKSGVCGATGTCALHAKGAACGGGVVCDAGSAKGRTCDGLGACVTDSAGTKCAPGTCSTTAGCSFTCTTDAECDATGFCDGGSCRARAANGATCTANNQCASAYCVDGVCCSTACTAVCEACNGAGTEGTCTAVTGPPRAGHGECAKGSGDACTSAACDGTARDACKALAGPEVSCRAASCTDGTEQLATKCDGSGTCPAASARSCAPFACAGTKCAATCASDADCSKGNRCDLATQKCVSTGACDGDHTVTGADGSKTECAPYKCDERGCKNLCESSADCASPNLCSSGRCIAPVVVEDSGGCAMSRTGSASSAMLLMLMAIAARARRSKKGAR